MVWNHITKTCGRAPKLLSDLQGGEVALAGELFTEARPIPERFTNRKVRSAPQYEKRPCFDTSDSHVSLLGLCLWPESIPSFQLNCEADESLAYPPGRRLFDAGKGVAGEWELPGELRCIAMADQAPETNLRAEVEREFVRLPITPATINIQPGGGRTYVNVPTIVHTTIATQTLTTNLLGTDVEVEVTPSSFTWDFNDNTPYVETADPGAPFPDQTIDHTYTRTGTAKITLVTTWSGRFRTGGTGQWVTITNTATTTTTAPELEIREAQARLVEDQLT